MRFPQAVFVEQFSPPQIISKLIELLVFLKRQNNFSKIAPEKNVFARIWILFKLNLAALQKNDYFPRVLLLTVTTNSFVVTLIFSQVVNIMNEYGLDRESIAQVIDVLSQSCTVIYR